MIFAVPIPAWYSITNHGDGSVSLKWFLEKDHAIKDQSSMSEPWSEPAYGFVDTYLGSDVHIKARSGSASMKEE